MDLENGLWILLEKKIRIKNMNIEKEYKIK